MLIRLSACRTAAAGATLTSGGALGGRRSSSCSTVVRGASSIWFSCIHSSLKTLDRYRSPVSQRMVTISGVGIVQLAGDVERQRHVEPGRARRARIPSSRASRRAISNESRSDTWRNSSIQSNQIVVGILSPPMPSTLYGWPSPMRPGAMIVGVE